MVRPISTSECKAFAAKLKRIGGKDAIKASKIIEHLIEKKDLWRRQCGAKQTDCKDLADQVVNGQKHVKKLVAALGKIANIAPVSTMQIGPSNRISEIANDAIQASRCAFHLEVKYKFEEITLRLMTPPQATIQFCRGKYLSTITLSDQDELTIHSEEGKIINGNKNPIRWVDQE